MRRSFTILFVSALCCYAANAAVIDVVPAPNSVRTNGRLCTIGSEIVSAEGLGFEADFLSGKLSEYGPRGGKVVLSIDSSIAEEGYLMKVGRRRISIKGGSAAGVFYGIQTLLQEAEAYGGKAMKGRIKDAPEYGWRGYMLDESRHFFGEKTVYEILDFMARYKLNRFHWHLTDAPGWRIEIKAYPELTVTGATGCHTDPTTPPAFYTQDQVRAIVAYASERHIQIVPEIDMPGHGSSATRSYPVLGVGDQPGSFTYNPGREEVYEFFAKVLAEVAELFPFEYLHIGGDEVAMGSRIWDQDPAIIALMEREGFTDVRQAEAYFHRRMVPVIHELGKKVLAWDDILELPLDKQEDVLTWWRHDRMDHLEIGQQKGYGVILCPRLPLYFDFVQDESHTSGRKWYKDGAFNPLENVYAFPESLGEEWNKGGVMGMQANLWTETVCTPKRVQYLTFPRICALAEDCWTSASVKDYDSFQSRIGKEYALFDSMDIYYCDFRDMDHHPEIID